MKHISLQVGPLLLFLQSAKTLGLDAERIRAELDPLPDDPRGLIPIEKAKRFWEVIHKLHAIPCLPAKLAQAVPFGSYGALDYLICTSENVGEFFRSYASYVPTIFSAVVVEIFEESEIVWVRLKFITPNIPPIIAESMVAGLMVRLRFALGKELVFNQILLPTSYRDHLDVYQKFFGENLMFSAPHAAIGIGKALWSTPLGSADPHLHEIVQNLTQTSSTKQPVTRNLAFAIRAELRKYFVSSSSNPLPKIEPALIAEKLNMSERTLQRRLAESGQTISAVVDEAKYEEAIRLLSLGEFSLMQIATHLRYADQASFSRAFKRWAGQTPADWKKTRSVKKK